MRLHNRDRRGRAGAAPGGPAPLDLWARWGCQDGSKQLPKLNTAGLPAFLARSDQAQRDALWSPQSARSHAFGRASSAPRFHREGRDRLGIAGIKNRYMSNHGLLNERRALGPSVLRHEGSSRIRIRILNTCGEDETTRRNGVSAGSEKTLLPVYSMRSRISRA